MLAGVFARKGFFVAPDGNSDLRHPDRANPEGYWEAQSLIDRNVEALAAAGFGPHNTWMFESITAEQVARIARLPALPGHRQFVDEYQKRAPWVWKDPRLCYTLAYWWPLVDPGGTQVLLIKRDPDAIVRSFERVGWSEPTEAARADVRRRIHDHVSAAEKSIESLRIPHLALQYDRFHEEGARIAEQLSDFVETTLTISDLRFEKRYDHSSARGRVTVLLERLVGRLPPSSRRVLKAVIPTSWLKRMFPGTSS